MDTKIKIPTLIYLYFYCEMRDFYLCHKNNEFFVIKEKQMR